MDLAGLAGGAVSERFGIEVQKVIENIMDPNTDFKKTRKLTLTLTFKANENRDIASVTIDTKAALAPAAGLSTAIIMDRDGHGRSVGTELFQTSLFKEQEVAATQESSKVSYLEQKQAGRV